LRLINSGYNPQGQGINNEIYQAFGGDDILEQIKKYDPNAKWTETGLNEAGNEAGGTGGGYGHRLDFDLTKLPQSEYGNALHDLRNSDSGRQLKNPDAWEANDVYGNVTNMNNLVKPQDPLWTKLAPIAVSMLAPMAGAALAGAGIGGAGLTAAATGSGLTGTGTLPSWATQLLTKAPQYAQSFANGGFDFEKLLPTIVGMGGSAMGINPGLIKAGLTLAQLSRGGR
jgi:hypothetical protein